MSLSAEGALEIIDLSPIGSEAPSKMVYLGNPDGTDNVVLARIGIKAILIQQINPAI